MENMNKYMIKSKLLFPQRFYSCADGPRFDYVPGEVSLMVFSKFRKEEKTRGLDESRA